MLSCSQLEPYLPSQAYRFYQSSQYLQPYSNQVEETFPYSSQPHHNSSKRPQLKKFLRVCLF